MCVSRARQFSSVLRLFCVRTSTTTTQTVTKRPWQQFLKLAKNIKTFFSSSVSIRKKFHWNKHVDISIIYDQNTKIITIIRPWSRPTKRRLYSTCKLVLIDMMQKRPVLNMHNGWTNGKVHVDWNIQIHLDVDTIVSFVIQRGQVSGWSDHVNCQTEMN